jgi:hypothetical protein
MSKNKILVTGLGVALALGLSAGVGVADASVPVSPACTTAKQNVVLAQARLDEATPTRTQLGNQVTAQKTARQSAVDAGNVELVGQINVQLGSSTASYNTMDSAVASAQAQLVRTKAAKTAAC